MSLVADRQPGTEDTVRRRRSPITAWRDFGRPPRLMGVDVARGIAVFGMIAAHAGIAASLELLDPRTWVALAEGRSSILFAVVAGISIAFAAGAGKRPTGEALRSARLRMAGRAIAVLAIGLLLELLGSSIVVILSVYGVLFLLVIPFLGLRRRTLVLTALALALTGPTLVAVVQTLTFGSWGEGVDFLINGVYPVTVWLPLMLTGIAVGRCTLGETRTAVAVLGVGAILTAGGYALGGLVDDLDGESGSYGSSSIEMYESVEEYEEPEEVPGEDVDLSGKVCVEDFDGWVTCFSEDWSDGEGSDGDAEEGDGYFESIGGSDLGAAVRAAWSSGPHSGGTLEIIASGGFALAVVGACLLLAAPLRWILIPIAAVGAMPLTAYAAHVVSFAVLSDPVNLAPQVLEWGPGGPGTGLWLVSVGVLLLGCTLWALTAGRGPLERITARAALAVDRPAGSEGDQR
ncbi:heparan-alpha-glucosaminide N-acetyltransferase domain-containing protein [Nocardiopsis metallicus]|uniref:Heparan-alpha-glucosaminide N-acetyltransferase catalytic domain-containing protein n=1 Tax=Nocardiopsis metallicus TaxID=179819 RepID=A0A840WSG6_9ACTN|nr:heparan-alpha-glucosaminide N-acetyltransferase domain-containing protein [Nocardiopsis metallicus]MBB5494497.1 hypothetical protein [Nocardiopsis metallicus]